MASLTTRTIVQSASTSSPSPRGANPPAYNAPMAPAGNSFPFTFTFTAPMPMQSVQQGYPLPPYGYAQGTNASSRDFDLSARNAFSLPTDHGFTFTAPRPMPNISQPVQQGASPVPYMHFHDPSASQSSAYYNGNPPAVYNDEGMDQTSDANQTVVGEVVVAVDEDTEMSPPGGESVGVPHVSRSKNFDIAKFAPYLVDYAENAILADLNDALDIRDGVEEGLYRGFA